MIAWRRTEDKSLDKPVMTLLSDATGGPFYQHGLTLIPACISNKIHYIVWDDITHPFLNFNGYTVDV